MRDVYLTCFLIATLMPLFDTRLSSQNKLHTWFLQTVSEHTMMHFAAKKKKMVLEEKPL